MPAGEAGLAPTGGVSGMDLNRLPQRRSIRLRDFDYTENRAYFVTICAIQKLCLFGDVEEEVVKLSDVGQVVDSAWRDLPNHTPGLTLDCSVVMPNHLHGIIILPGPEKIQSRANVMPRRDQSGSLGTVIGGFKSAVSREVNVRDLTLVRPIWQRNYYERIIRNDGELDATRRYIVDNPIRWNDDPDHPRYHTPSHSPQRM
jgi:putative transposase